MGKRKRSECALTVCCPVTFYSAYSNTYKSGPPGVGKTLTAEGVSEHLQKPLYSVRSPERKVIYFCLIRSQISAGELGIDARELEKQLSNIFQIAKQWDAILLLDEADVFLEKRSSQNLQRNGLVSVFLRKLEYCTGILFLTTNRVSEFDEAILSRIHLLLRYNNLTSDARRDIWANFLKRAHTQKGAANISPNQLESLVKSELNGRQVCCLLFLRELIADCVQIKNAVAAAHALATRQGAQLSHSQLQQAVKTSKKFLDEFYSVPRMFV
jgi:SpoVK/Ycf46/Vps4 family AAA+-type ATPase